MFAKKNMKFVLVAILLSCVSFVHASEALHSSDKVVQTPKKIVTDFFKMAFVDRKPIKAAEKYISKDMYIQHNPQGKDGREAFIDGFAAYMLSTNYAGEIKMVIAENDLVFVHSHCKTNPLDPKDLGESVMDVFRVKDGKIVEHWDTVQAVPEKSENSNTMF